MKYIVVWVSERKSLLCKQYADGHYEVEAKGTSAALKKLAEELNGKDVGFVGQ